MADQILFITLIFLAIITTVYYFWGRRRNLTMVKTIGRALEQILDPVDRDYTWLGGTIGFHARYRTDGFRSVETTLTLLPRQSLLYYPVSFMVSGFDRLYMTFFLKGKPLPECHLIEKGYLKHRGPEITNIASLSRSELNYNGREFLVLFRDEDIKDRLIGLCSRLDKDFTGLKHIAIVPERNTLFFLIIPCSGWNGFVEGVVREFGSR